MDLNVIFAISALGLFSLLAMLRISYKIPIAAAMLCFLGAGVLIYLEHSAIGNTLALAMFYLLILGVLMYLLDHLVALKKGAKAAGPDQEK